MGVHGHPLFDLNYCIFCKFLYLLIGDARPAQPERAASPSQMISCVGVEFIRSPSASSYKMTDLSPHHMHPISQRRSSQKTHRINTSTHNILGHCGPRFDLCKFIFAGKAARGHAASRCARCGPFGQIKLKPCAPCRIFPRQAPGAVKGRGI